jgi:hypothetical protein
VVACRGVTSEVMSRELEMVSAVEPVDSTAMAQPKANPSSAVMGMDRLSKGAGTIETAEVLARRDKKRILRLHAILPCVAQMRTNCHSVTQYWSDDVQSHVWKRHHAHDMQQMGGVVWR